MNKGEFCEALNNTNAAINAAIENLQQIAAANTTLISHAQSSDDATGDDTASTQA